MYNTYDIYDMIHYTVANEIVRTPKKNAVKRKQKDQFCSNWF